ncbi:histidine kinase [Duganella sp. BJB488]|uniref:cache domain-containing protein n=1 Tax=unclassified Duganella TaxID=2636909 RepID=UPI000E34DC46|nr:MULTISPECIES: cache domain-containing protein [unclassified Duganella]RFP09279.1 histidine kinase [Duganella sp. BJB475]RFP13168.1 histidine kinase [Duganella sp. BJB489]RFP17069.1 histidine kinase [Duganella sp. BJB488]RFP25314.1 histidine kinase [Duganella sp. BJB476]RFP31522.1 histidine kinase [Duganella sp. BJB480]
MRTIFRNITLGLFALEINTTALAASDRGTADEAVVMVKKAVAYLKANGKEKAYTEFSNPKGQFVDRSLYIFVYDMKGNNLAIGNGNASKMVGKNLIEMRDADGVYLIKNFIEIANTKGNGWSDYKWPNPVNATIEPKSSYVEKVGDVLIGCGIYK